MVGQTGARARDAVPNLKCAARARADVQRRASAAIAKRNGHVQPTAHGFNGGGDAVARGFVQDLSNKVRTLSGGIEQISPASLDQHALGAWADQRPLVLDEQTCFRRQRRGHLHHARHARAAVLQDLFHVSASDSSRRSSASLSPTMNSWKAWNTHSARPARPSRKPRRTRYMYTNKASGLAGTRGHTRSRKK